MGFSLKTEDYIQYFKKTKDIIADQKEYITELDASTGDGDHWVNIHKGFEKIVELSDQLENLSLSDMFKKSRYDTVFCRRWLLRSLIWKWLYCNVESL